MLFLSSCGYTKTEDDRYPEMPIFPKTTNENILISEAILYKNKLSNSLKKEARFNSRMLAKQHVRKEFNELFLKGLKNNI